jgi:hypothetical protein
MPHVDGISLAKIVRARWPAIAIVVTSGALPDGGNLEIPEDVRFVRKPYKAETLIEELEAAIAETARLDVSAAPIALTSIPNFQAGQMHGAGGLAQPLPEPEE